MMIDLKEYQINEVIITEKDIDEYLYLIKSGKVKVIKSIDNKDVEIACLTKGAFFGEMALIDERPRTATVIAMEETILKVFHRDDFLQVMHENQDIAVKFLSGIFSRLREANSKFNPNTKDDSLNDTIKEKEKNQTVARILEIEGLSEKAIDSLPENPCNILVNQSSFNIGRKSSDPFTNNSLDLKDSRPFQISRNHFSIQIQNDNIAIYDIGSSIGLCLNNKRIGGMSGSSGPLFLNDENILILGSDGSEYKYQIAQK